MTCAGFSAATSVISSAIFHPKQINVYKLFIPSCYNIYGEHPYVIVRVSLARALPLLPMSIPGVFFHYLPGLYIQPIYPYKKYWTFSYRLKRGGIFHLQRQKDSSPIPLQKIVKKQAHQIFLPNVPITQYGCTSTFNKASYTFFGTLSLYFNATIKISACLNRLYSSKASSGVFQ